MMGLLILIIGLPVAWFTLHALAIPEAMARVFGSGKSDSVKQLISFLARWGIIAGVFLAGLSWLTRKRKRRTCAGCDYKMPL